jgi:site-specific DNA-methyltransferase (adenine-specific)
MIDLRQGDCLEILRNIGTESVDFIFTDPPYKLTGGGSKNSLLRNKKANNPFSTTGECFNVKTPNFEDWIPKIYRVLKPNSYAVIMVNDMNLLNLYKACENVGFKFCELLVMKKNNKVPSSYFFKQCEYLLLLRKGKYKQFNKFGISNLFEVTMPRGKEKKHPTEKPAIFIQTIIECLTKENDIILDCFMGSGSTGIACLKSNRSFIGIELDGKYFNIAEERINNITRHHEDKGE